MSREKKTPPYSSPFYLPTHLPTKWRQKGKQEYITLSPHFISPFLSPQLSPHFISPSISPPIFRRNEGKKGKQEYITLSLHFISPFLSYHLSPHQREISTLHYLPSNLPTKLRLKGKGSTLHYPHLSPHFTSPSISPLISPPNEDKRETGVHYMISPFYLPIYLPIYLHTQWRQKMKAIHYSNPHRRLKSLCMSVCVGGTPQYNTTQHKTTQHNTTRYLKTHIQKLSLTTLTTPTPLSPLSLSHHYYFRRPQRQQGGVSEGVSPVNHIVTLCICRWNHKETTLENLCRLNRGLLKWWRWCSSEV